MTTELTGVPDLADPETFRAGVPHMAYDLIRELPGLAWQPADAGTLTGGFWVVTRYDEAVQVLQDADRFQSGYGAVYPLPNPTRMEPLSKSIQFMDSPDHSRVRRSAAKSFGPRVVANFESWIREVIVETLDDALPRQRFDWIEKVCQVIPPLVIAQILGVPRERWGFVVDSSHRIFVAQSAKDGGISLADEFTKIGGYLTELGEEKLKNPADDMTTLLAQSHAAGEVDFVEYQMYLVSLLIAGAETTNTTMAHIGHLLATDPQIRDVAARALDEGKSGELVEEFLRYITPAMNFARVASRETELNGQLINKDDLVVVSLIAANRDPAAFPHPNTFDPFREGTKPLGGTGGAGMSFGAGPHRCIGHMLAKLELRIFLEELHARGVAVSMDGDPERGASGVVNQLLTLPVAVSVG
ncbi:cytochrome P450 (plasmid) [Nocardioides sp. R1-1]|uniref:cytochrome P450 n=1 Tax=Nocardioides sp. R1-1 TaxID=3383502 RepID=UPI0038D24D30